MQQHSAFQIPSCSFQVRKSLESRKIDIQYFGEDGILLGLYSLVLAFQDNTTKVVLVIIIINVITFWL